MEYRVCIIGMLADACLSEAVRNLRNSQVDDGHDPGFA
jgi:hypothetical protein